jgi:hypothetical protein
MSRIKGVFKNVFINLLMFFTKCSCVFKRKTLKDLGDEIHTGVSPELANKIFEQVNQGGDVFNFAKTQNTIKNQDVESYTVVLKGK